jgi:hypothetical protein
MKYSQTSMLNVGMQITTMQAKTKKQIVMPDMANQKKPKSLPFIEINRLIWKLNTIISASSYRVSPAIVVIKEILCYETELNCHHENLPLDSILRQSNSVHSFTTYFLKFHISIILHHLS